jgi:transcriptional regulator GlxA family with amidase domain
MMTDEGDPMTKVTMLALEEAAASTITGPMDFLSSCRRDDTTGKVPQPCFKIEIVTTDGFPARCRNGVLIQPHRSMHEVGKTDIIIVSPIARIEKVLDKEGKVVDWLKAHHENGVYLAAIDSGAFLLAETGLLNGQEATTNRESIEAFRRRYPAVLLKPERPITDQNRMLCAGSANSSFDLAAYLAMKIYGFEMPSEWVKIQGYDAGIARQALFSKIIQRRRPTGNPIRISQQWMANNYSKPLNMGQLAKMCGMSRRTFERHFKSITNGTPLQYLQRIRVEKAKQMLEAGEGTFQEITYQVGYEDSCYFRKLFEKLTGRSPSACNKRGFGPM